MAQEYSDHQRKIIRRFYDNREDIALQRAQELVTELYLTEGKKRAKNWDLLAGHLKALKISEETIAHLRSQDDPAEVAKLIAKRT